MEQHRYFGWDGKLAGVSLEERVSLTIQAEVERVGCSLDVIPELVSNEMTRVGGRSICDILLRNGIDVAGKVFVDIGAGMGGIALEAGIRGAWPLAIEPGPGLRDIASERLRELGTGAAIAASGERLPLPDNSVDVIVSLSVLEHVSDPDGMLREAFRVLRPGGHFYLQCENYLGWYEPHYRVRWVPLMPKWLGAIYLRAKGRPTEFLYTSITYVTRPRVIRTLRKCGFEFLRMETWRQRIQNPHAIKAGWIRKTINLARKIARDETLVRAAFYAQQARMGGMVIREIVRKPQN